DHVADVCDQPVGEGHLEPRLDDLDREVRDLHAAQPFLAATIHSSAAPGARRGLRSEMSSVGSGLPAMSWASSLPTTGPCMVPWPPKPAAIHSPGSTSPTSGCPPPPRSTWP